MEMILVNRGYFPPRFCSLLELMMVYKEGEISKWGKIMEEPPSLFPDPRMVLTERGRGTFDFNYFHLFRYLTYVTIDFLLFNFLNVYYNQ